MDPLERVSEQLSRPWGVVSHLKGVRDSEALREAYDEMQPKVRWWSWYQTSFALGLG